MPNYNEALRYEIFVKEEYACAKSAILQADLIFDIGGHLGYFSEWCRSLGSEAEIHYFEPLPFLYKEAKERLKDDPKITFHNFGIGAKEEEISFFVNEEKSMQSSHYESFLNKNGKKVKVQMKQFSRERARPFPNNIKFPFPNNIKFPFPNNIKFPFPNNIKSPFPNKQIKTVMKLDIEGMEYEVLESRDNEIRNNIWTLIMEIHFLKDGDEKKYKKLKKKLEQIFWTVQEKISTYTDKIRLIFAEK